MPTFENNAAIQYASDNLFSDLHKDAYGFRPSQGQWQRWAQMSVAQLEVEYDRMCRHLEAELDREKAAQAEATVKFEATIVELIATGAGNRATAIRWLQQAYKAEDDIGYLEYQMGLPYNYLGLRYAA